MKNKLKMNTALLAISCIIGMGTSQLYADDIYSLEDYSSGKYTKHYNTLASVEDADAKLQSHPKFKPFLEKAEEVVTCYELESHVGFRLIHRHFDAPDGAIMSETYEDFKGIPSLVTTAHTSEEALQQKALPSSWIFTTAKAKDVQFFEASSDPAVVEGIRMLSKDQEFMTEMGDLLAEDDLNTLLSVAILRRDLLKPTRDDQIFLEVNETSPDIIVVQIWDADKSSQNTIRTSWSFKGPRQHRCWWASECTYQLGLRHKNKITHKK